MLVLWVSVVNKLTPFLVLAVAAGAAYLIYLLAPILTPFLVAALLAYIWDPVVDRLEAWKLPRTLGVVLLFLVLVLALLVLFLVVTPLLQEQIVVFAGKIPAYLDWLQGTLLPWLRDSLGVDTAALDFDLIKQRLLEHWRDVGGWVATFMTQVTQSGVSLVAWLVNLVLIPVVTFYLLRDWDHIVARVHGLPPLRYRDRLVRLARETDEVLSSFLRGQLLVMLILALVYSIGLWFVGLDLALPIGLIAGLVSFVPYLGFILGLLAAGVAAVFQFQEAQPLLWILAVFGAGQLLEGMVLTPRLIGERVGLHPVAVIFAVMAGAQLFGFFGILLALPVAAAVMVWLRYLHSRYQKSAFYKE